MIRKTFSAASTANCGLLIGLLMFSGAFAAEPNSSSTDDGSLRMALQPKKLRGGGKIIVEKSDANARNDVEGAIWQYTATKGKEELNGEFRIKGKAIYAPAKDYDDGKQNQGKDAEQREAKEEAPKGQKRVGDVIANEKSAEGEMQLVFTHYKPLDGRAVVKRQGKNKSTANLVGYFNAKDGSRWKFELRRAED